MTSRMLMKLRSRTSPRSPGPTSAAYWASLAAIFCVFRPKMFVATSVVNRLRLAATVCGGTVDVNAVW